MSGAPVSFHDDERSAGTTPKWRGSSSTESVRASWSMTRVTDAARFAAVRDAVVRNGLQRASPRSLGGQRRVRRRASRARVNRPAVDASATGRCRASRPSETRRMSHRTKMGECDERRPFLERRARRCSSQSPKVTHIRQSGGPNDGTNRFRADIDVPVLVIGGSLVGLATSMFLAQHGVEVLSVEKHYGTAIHPRAGYFQLRTIELMRVPASRIGCARPRWSSTSQTVASTRSRR